MFRRSHRYDRTHIARECECTFRRNVSKVLKVGVAKGDGAFLTLQTGKIVCGLEDVLGRTSSASNKEGDLYLEGGFTLKECSRVCECWTTFYMFQHHCRYTGDNTVSIL